MKELSIYQKGKVIKLFLKGETYDEIAKQVGIAKGSVVNVVDDFREGYLSLPPGMIGYVDELRKLVVDMKKHDTSVAQLKGYCKLHAKLKEMGVGDEQAGTWLEICEEIATESVSNQQFVEVALELAHLASENGLSYTDAIANYNSKLDASTQLDKQIERKEEKLEQLKSQYKEEKKQATEMLNSINKAIATAQGAFQKQKKELDAQLKQHVVQHKLSWEKVDTTLAILNDGLAESGLEQEEVDKISKDITQAGSLVVHIKKLESEKNELDTAVNQMTAQQAELEIRNALQAQIKSELMASTIEKSEEEKAVHDRLQLRKTDLAGVEYKIACHADMMGLTYLILNFLVSPDGPSDEDIEQLTRMIIFIRQDRLGIDPVKYNHVGGEVFYECKLPESYFAQKMYPVKIDDAKKKLALCLVPLVKTEFMPIQEWEFQQFQKIMTTLSDINTGIKTLPKAQ